MSRLKRDRRRPVVYVAGPMRGIKYFNYPAFDAAAHKLTKMGFDVINPAQMDRDVGFDVTKLPDDYDWNSMTEKEGCTLRDVFDRDMQAICQNVDVIYCLPGWKKSKGARAEVALGRALGLYRMDAL